MAEIERPRMRQRMSADGIVSESHAPDCPCPRCVGFTPGADGTGALLATRHGAKSVVEIQGRASEVAEGLREVMQSEGFYRATFEPTIAACAVVLVRIERAALAIDQVDVALAAEGVSPLAAYLDAGERSEALIRLREDMRRWLNTAKGYLETLGLTPAALARISRDTGIGRTTRAQAALRELNAHLEAHHVEENGG